jgi:hypothetical protein
LYLSGGGNAIQFILNSSGNVGVGRTPSAWNAIYKGLVVGGTSGNTITLAGNDASIGTGYYLSGAGIYNRDNGSATVSSINMYNRAFVFRTAASGAVDSAIAWTDSMTLNASGQLLVNTTVVNGNAANSVATFKSSIADWTSAVWNSSAAPFGLLVQYDSDPNSVGREFLACYGAANVRAKITSNGGISNYQANDVNLSDIRTKTDIKPLTSYWNKIKALELVTFKYKDQTHDDDNIGLIAQQVESVAPEFVDVDGFGKTPEDGVPLKTIYTTDLYHAAIKALQEAMIRIEVLESKLA